MSKTQDSFSMESLGAYSQPSNGSASYAPAPAPAQAQQGNKILVPRRLNDNVQLSRESSRDEESASALCSNFMAAWG